MFCELIVVKLVTFTTGTCSGRPVRDMRKVAIASLRDRFSRSSARERRQYFDHRAIVEHDRLRIGFADGIGVYQERRPGQHDRQTTIRFPARYGGVKSVTQGKSGD